MHQTVLDADWPSEASIRFAPGVRAAIVPDKIRLRFIPSEEIH